MRDAEDIRIESVYFNLVCIHLIQFMTNPPRPLAIPNPQFFKSQKASNVLINPLVLRAPMAGANLLNINRSVTDNSRSAEDLPSII